MGELGQHATSAAVFLAVLVLTIIVGAIGSPGAGLALIATGLAVAVIVDVVTTQRKS
jgi:hypothetical protein